MGAPFGNTNAHKGRRFNAILERISAEEEYKSLEQAARNLLSQASAKKNSLRAIEVLRDTVDGRPAQMVHGPGEEGEFIVRWQEK